MSYLDGPALGISRLFGLTAWKGPLGNSCRLNPKGGDDVQ